MPQTIHVGDAIDQQRVSVFSVVLLTLAVLANASDGYDIFAIGYAVPVFIREWHIPPAELGPVFSASIIGLFFGYPLFGFIGDRWGRKTAIVSSMLCYGAMSFVTMGAGSVHALLAIRFITGIGLGGVIPNVTALTAEFAPKRIRAVFIMITSVGVPLGASLPSFVSALFLARYGWTVLFLVGGVLPLAVAAVFMLAVPESIKFRVVLGRRPEKIAAALARFRPAIAVASDTRFVMGSEAAVNSISPAPLFRDGLAWITSLLWFCYAMNMVATFFVANWMPTLLQQAGASSAAAALATGMFSIGAFLGGLFLLLTVDRYGLVPITLLFWLAVPLLLAIGLAGGAGVPVTILATLAGACVVGVNFGINAVNGMIYATPIRAKGAGWCNAIGRFGAVAGPILGGVFIGMHWGEVALFAVPAASSLLGAVAMVLLTRLCLARFAGYGLDEHAATISENPASAGLVLSGSR